MEFKILGKTRLHINGNDFPLGSAKQRGLLALLLYYTGRPVPVDRIAGVLWRASTRVDVRSKLQPLISRLRKVLDRSGSGGRIAKDGDGYQLQIPAELVDYHRFRTLAEKGRAAAARNDHHTAKDLLREALDLWQGRPLQELDGPWAEHCRDQMELFDRLAARQVLLDSQLQLREHVEVMGEAGRLTREHRLNENFARLYIQSLDGLGEYARALEFHARFCEHLYDEAGVEPGPELRRIYQGILRKQAGTAPAGPPNRRALPQELPRDIRKFAGRAKLLARMDDVLASGAHDQVVALHGMPGIGKTRLAIRWAHRNADHFPDGQLVLDLQGFGPGNPLAPDDALGILLARLDAGPVPVPPAERRAKLRRVLHDRRVLLLLDNARDSNQVRPILDATTSCFTIITSRTRPFALSVHQDAVALHVPPLSAAESVALLRDVVGADRADENPEAISELAGSSDGHPLALKIVAQHVALRPEIALSDLVDDFNSPEGLGVLGSSDDSDDENATLAAAFAWSYRALPPETARVFRLLGLHFTTEFGPEAAGALSGEPVSTTTRHLSTLTRANLLQYGATKRFRLHDLLHGYAVDLVRHEDSLPATKSALTGLFNHYLASATAACERLNPNLSPVPPLVGVPEAAAFESDQQALDWLAAERANLVAAVPRAVARGFPEYAWRLSANVHEVFDRLGYYEDLLSCQRAAIKAAMVLRDRKAQAGTLADTGTVQYRLGQYDEAVASLEQSVAISREQGFTEMEAIAVNNLASVHLARGEVGKAVNLMHRVLAAARTLKITPLEAATLEQLGAAHRRMERDDEALEFFEAALTVWRSSGEGSSRGEGAAQINIGRLLHEHGENELALTRLEAALAVNQASGDRSRMIETLVTKAEVHYDLGQFTETVACAGHAADLCAMTSATEHHVRALHILGHAAVALGEPDAAERHWLEAIALSGDRKSFEGNLLSDHLAALKNPSGGIPGPRDCDSDVDQIPDSAHVAPVSGTLNQTPTGPASSHTMRHTNTTPRATNSPRRVLADDQ
ncbi:BTAD domain-containing putative transcriptional regulator [Actinosynnema sp. NPDC050436]|uniref:AfsR/SARP family transcriptional regulator n=1 Tax=Actinosynnema sp. NPDC050436 TaxID=3155659 RepID=UPI0033DF8DA7